MHNRRKMLILASLLVLVTAAFATIIISGRSLTSASFRVVWIPGAEVEAITSLHQKGSPNLTGSYALDTCNDGDVEYFGNAWAPPDPQAGGTVLVGSGTSAGTWSGTVNPVGLGGTVNISSRSTGCAPSSSNIPINTVYNFDDSGSTTATFQMQRQFDFGEVPFAHHFRPYIPRLSLNSGFTQVIYPVVKSATGKAPLVTVDSRSCDTGCTGPIPAPGAAKLSLPWDSTKGWFAMHNPTTGQGMIVLRQPSFRSSRTPIAAQLWVDWDGGSNTNSSSFLLLSPSSGFTGRIYENETFCFYDKFTWTPSLTLPNGCGPTGDWPQFHYGPERTGYNAAEHVLSPSNVSRMILRWSVALSGEVRSSPVVANGVVYVGSTDGTLYAFNANSGALLWSTPTGAIWYSVPAVANGIVYVGTNYPDSKLHAFDAATGAALWSQDINFSVLAAPVVGQGVVYTVSSTGYVYAFSAKTGIPLWVTDSGQFWVEFSLAVANGVVYVGTSDQFALEPKLLALDAATGAVLWKVDSGGWIWAAPAIANGIGYAGSSPNGGYFHAFDAKTGGRLWTTAIEVDSSTPAVAYGMVYVGSADHNLYAFDAVTGTALWNYLTGWTVESSPAVANGVVYVGSDDWNLHALNATTGAQLWSYDTVGWIGQSSPAVANGMVYVNSIFPESRLYCFGLPQ